MAHITPKQPEPPATAQSPTSSPTSNPTTPEMESILATLRPIAKYKARSYETSKNTHIPLLEAHLNTHHAPPTTTTTDTTPSDAPTDTTTTSSNPPPRSPTVVLLGDSMLERMTTTASSPNYPGIWPSPTMLPDGTIAQYNSKGDPPLRRLAAGTVFNAGVGGDKIQNLAYRLVGDEERGLGGLLSALVRCGARVKVWVVHVGTNNLSAKHGGFKEGDLRALEVIVRALLGVGDVQGVRSKVVVTSLFQRKDITDEAVYERVNGSDGIKGMCKFLGDQLGLDRVDWLETPPGFKMEEYLEDHVHLNLEGYRWWAEWLFPKVREYLGNGNVYWEEEEEETTVVEDGNGHGGAEEGV